MNFDFFYFPKVHVGDHKVCKKKSEPSLQMTTFGYYNRYLKILRVLSLFRKMYREFMLISQKQAQVFVIH